MMFTFQSKIRLLLKVFLFSLLISGCGVWENLTTYFNLYHNASNLFEKAERQILSPEKDLFSTEPPKLPGTANADLVKVIEKCSDLLQFNSESAYVEDALMMLGKSFYYQKNYQKSLRKFKELEETFSESSNLLESQLWIGKCQMRLKNYNDALTTLSIVRKQAVDEGESDIMRESYVEEIVYKVTIEDFKNAVEIANEFMDVSDDDDIKARVWYGIGQLNMKIGEIENAIIAFQNVFEYSPDFDLEFDAKMQLAKALREGNRSEEALVIFSDMRDEDKYSTDFGEIDFEIAKTQRALGNIEVAVDLFTEVDTLYRNTQTSSAAKFELGQIYQYEYLQLDSAAVYYKKASTSSLPKEYIQPAREKNRLFTRYLVLNNDVKKYGKQLFYLENPDVFVKDSAAYVNDSLAIAEEISNITELQAIWAGLDSLINVKDTTGFYADTIRAIDSLIVSDTTLVKDSLIAKLQNPLPGDSTFIAKFDSLYTSEGFKIKTGQNLNLQQKQLSQQNQLANQLPDSLKFKNNPPRKPTISEDSLRTLLAKNELELGNLFLAELELPDTAKSYYINILTNYPNTTYQASTIYALGSYYLTIDNKERADSLFNVIYENYRNEAIVNAAAAKLDKPFIDLNYDPAKNDYEDAEYVMQNENYDDALELFYKVYRTYPNSPYAAKALYTSGWILENKLSQPDSAAAVYDSLVVNYPASVYVRSVAEKLSFYKQEQRRLQLAALDSLNGSDISGTDSLALDSLNQNLTEYEKISDTSQVARREEDRIPEERNQDEKITTLPKIKEPLWNPRTRR
jgi:TolA-binding protein